MKSIQYKNEEAGKEALAKCIALINHVEKAEYDAAYALATIRTEELWRYDERHPKSMEEFIKLQGYSRSHVSRLTRCYNFFISQDLPQQCWPSEGAMRPLLYKCFSDDERLQIFQNACEKEGNVIIEIPSEEMASEAEQEECEKLKILSEDDECEEKAERRPREKKTDKTKTMALAPKMIRHIKPTAANIRQALREYRSPSAILLPSAHSKVEKGTSFTETFNRCGSTVTDIVALCNLLRDFLQNGGVLDEADQTFIRTQTEKFCAEITRRISEMSASGTVTDAPADAAEEEDDDEND